MSSPLLSLPGEIREKILRFLLGDKVVHIMSLRITPCENVVSISPDDKMQVSSDFSRFHRAKE